MTITTAQNATFILDLYTGVFSHGGATSGGNEVFNYRLVDGDGDWVESTLTIVIDDLRAPPTLLIAQSDANESMSLSLFSTQSHDHQGSSDENDILGFSAVLSGDQNDDLLEKIGPEDEPQPLNQGTSEGSQSDLGQDISELAHQVALQLMQQSQNADPNG